MNISLLGVLVATEARLRLRRPGSLVAVLAVIVISWLMISDPQTGTTLIAINNARVLYTSSTLALGSASLASLLFGLAGFYLVRGRFAEDLRSGTGAVIAATSVTDSQFLLGRWLGSVLYLIILTAFFGISILVYQLLHGESPVELDVYLLTYTAQLLPMVFFVVSCAMLFDSFAPLMGKRGDIIYFFIWTAQVSLISKLGGATGTHIQTFMLFDFIGATMSMVNLKMLIDTNSVSLGFATFNAALPAVVLPPAMWPASLIALRVVTALFALLLLFPAIVLFHRFSPDRVKLQAAQKRRSPLAYLNQFMRPLSRLSQPLFRLGYSLPGLTGRVLADLALTIATTPVAALAISVIPVLSLFTHYRALPALLLFSIAVWGILIGDISCRDHLNATNEITGVLQGGIAQRYLRQFAASVMLGILLTGVIATRLAFHEPVLAMALLSGLLSMSALASLLGRLSRTPRTFLSLFLFGLYIAVNGTKVSMIDVFGFNGVANIQSILVQCALAITLFVGGYLYNSRPS